MKNLLLALGLAAALAQPAQAIVYDVDRVIGDGSVKGFIETDGTIGALQAVDIVDWVLTISTPTFNGGAPETAIEGTSSLFAVDSFLSATATELLFDFGGTASGSFSNFSGLTWCFAGIEFSGCMGERILFIGDRKIEEFAPGSGVVAIGTVAAVPLPAALLLLLGGLAALGCAGFRRRAAS